MLDKFWVSKMLISLKRLKILFHFSSRYEHFFGPLATHNLCVTNAMKDDLQKNWGIKYDLFCTHHSCVYNKIQ